MKEKVLRHLLLMCILACSVIGCGSVEKENEETITNNKEVIVDEAQKENEATVEQRSDTDFRNACWGDSFEDVKKYETEAEYVDEDEGILLYSDFLLGTKVNIIYMFENNKLYRCGYMCTSEYTTGGQYINAYNSWLEALTEKYGDPDDDSGIRTTESQDLIDMAGESKALEYGYTAYVAYWDTEKTDIRLGLTSENYEMALGLYYTDASYQEDNTAGF